MTEHARGADTDPVRTQTVSLHAGWNAVFLEVYPPDSDPDAAFAGTAIDRVATYYSCDSSAQFATDPGVNLFRDAGWGVWYAKDRPDAFLRSLHAIYGGRAYLVHALTDCAWTVTGAVVAESVKWEPDTYNFVGFSLNAQAPPTFRQFFAGSQAHNHNRIYRLVNGAWRQITNPDATAMRSGEAFWIYCDGRSDYQGPLTVETSTSKGLCLGASGGAVTLRSRAPHPLTPTIEHVPCGPKPVPLSTVIQVVGDPSAPVGTASASMPVQAWTQPLPTLEVGESIQVPLEARMEEMTSRVHVSLLKITTDLGTETWLPVFAVREDLETQ